MLTFSKAHDPNILCIKLQICKELNLWWNYFLFSYSFGCLCLRKIQSCFDVIPTLYFYNSTPVYLLFPFTIILYPPPAIFSFITIKMLFVRLKTVWFLEIIIDNLRLIGIPSHYFCKQRRLHWFFNIWETVLVQH